MLSTVRLNYLMAGVDVLSVLNFISVRFFQFYLSCVVSDLVCVDVLDGAMVVLAVYTMNLAHPGRLLGVSSEGSKASME